MSFAKIAFFFATWSMPMHQPRRLYQIDAFTNRPFAGNPAGVVANADGLTEGQMQAIARELNNSETAFLLPPLGPDHDVHVRFFTPTTEVPICGHEVLPLPCTRWRTSLLGIGISVRITTTASDVGSTTTLSSGHDGA